MSDPIEFQFEALPDFRFAYTPSMGLSWSLTVNGEARTLNGTRLPISTPEGEKVIKLSVSGLDFTSPTFSLGEEQIRPLPPIPTGLLIAACMPFGLVTQGLLGLLLGGPVFLLNIWFARMMRGSMLKRLVCILAASLTAAGTWFFLRN